MTWLWLNHDSRELEGLLAIGLEGLKVLYWCSPGYPGYPSNALPVLVYSFSDQNSYFTFVVTVLISITHLIKVMIFSEMLRMLQNFFFVSAAEASSQQFFGALSCIWAEILSWYHKVGSAVLEKKCTFCSHMTCTSINISTVCQRNAFLHHYNNPQL